MAVSSANAVVVVGAGPAGLSAAYELVTRGIGVAVYEKADVVGGLARTVRCGDCLFDVGGHRYLTAIPDVQRLWRRVLGEDLLPVTRQSRIHYRGRFFEYPISLGNVVANLGAWESLLILSSFARAQLRRRNEAVTLEQWVTHRFGRRLYEMFFRDYTTKVWGMPPSDIQAEWAAQRIRDLSLKTAVRHALFGGTGVRSLADRFLYPRLGAGQMWERLAALVQASGGSVRLRSEVTRLRHDGTRITHVEITDPGGTTTVPVDQVITSAPLAVTLACLDPPASAGVLESARSLRHRDFIMVGLVLDAPASFPDNWIYVHSPSVRVGRIQNFKNWSPAMVPGQGRTTLGLEYFCSLGDDTWQMSDAELIDLACRELTQLRLAEPSRVTGGCVIRQPLAYPVYDHGYVARVACLREHLSRLGNLQTIGRNGTHAYNNMDHSTLAGLLAARNLLGERHDVWQINDRLAYLEEQAAGRMARAGWP